MKKVVQASSLGKTKIVFLSGVVLDAGPKTDEDMPDGRTGIMTKHEHFSVGVVRQLWLRRKIRAWERREEGSRASRS